MNTLYSTLPDSQWDDNGDDDEDDYEDEDGDYEHHGGDDKKTDACHSLVTALITVGEVKQKDSDGI